MNKKHVIIVEFILAGLLIATAVICYLFKQYVACAVLATLAVVTLIVAINASIPKKDEYKLTASYRRKKAILTTTEIDFLAVIKSVVDLSRYDVAYQVPLVAVIDKVTNNSFRNELFRVIDYMIVDKISYAPLLLIELNDASHTRADRIERDKKVSAICANAKMPLITFDLSNCSDVSYVKKQIRANILK